MGQPAKAQQVYEILLEQATEERSKAPIYNQLGVMKDDLGEYPEAIAYYEKSIKIEEKQIPRNDQNLAKSYNNIGAVYTETWVTIRKHFRITKKHLQFNNNHFLPITLIWLSSYNNIGIKTWVTIYEKALGWLSESTFVLWVRKHFLEASIQQQSLPPNHPDLAMSHYNMGLLYEKMGNYSKAHSFLWTCGGYSTMFITIKSPLICKKCIESTRRYKKETVVYICFRKRRIKRIEWKILAKENILARAYRETLIWVRRQQRGSHPSARQPIHIRRRGLQRRPAQISLCFTQQSFLCWMQTNSDPTGDRSGLRKRDRGWTLLAVPIQEECHPLLK